MSQVSYLWMKAILQEDLSHEPSAAKTVSRWGYECVCFEERHATASTTHVHSHIVFVLKKDTPQHPLHVFILTLQETEFQRKKVNSPESHGKVME